MGLNLEKISKAREKSRQEAKAAESTETVVEKAKSKVSKDAAKSEEILKRVLCSLLRRYMVPYQISYYLKQN